jgi:hypothetical protein
MRRSDCAGRAGVDAARARPAAGHLGRIGRQFKRGENFSKEKPGPELAVEQHRAFAMPADPGFGSKVAFQHRTGIDIKFLLPTGCGQKAVERPQFFLQHVMVIVTPGIAGDAASRWSCGL